MGDVWVLRRTDTRWVLRPATWDLYAHHCPERSDPYWNIKVHGLPHPIVAVAVSLDDNGPYYGWQDVGEYDKPPTMIWPRKVLFVVRLRVEPRAAP